MLAEHEVVAILWNAPRAPMQSISHFIFDTSSTHQFKRHSTDYYPVVSLMTTASNQVLGTIGARVVMVAWT
jgi:hypothetical protein